MVLVVDRRLVVTGPDFASRMRKAQEERRVEEMGRLRAAVDFWRRVCVCLVRASRGEVEMCDVEGHPAVARSDLDAVPAHFSLRAGDVGVQVGEEEEDGSHPKVLPYVVLVVERREGGNGVLRPSGPRLVLP